MQCPSGMLTLVLVLVQFIRIMLNAVAVKIFLLTAHGVPLSAVTGLGNTGIGGTGIYMQV